jgi:hypothetical protein
LNLPLLCLLPNLTRNLPRSSHIQSSALIEITSERGSAAVQWRKDVKKESADISAKDFGFI